MCPEHTDLRRQVARFIEREVEPNALACDEAGCTPRELLPKFGALDWLGRLPAAGHGGATEVMLAEVAKRFAVDR